MWSDTSSLSPFLSNRQNFERCLRKAIMSDWLSSPLYILILLSDLIVSFYLKLCLSTLTGICYKSVSMTIGEYTILKYSNCFISGESILSSNFWMWIAFSCLSVGYSHCICMHLNICAILFWMFDREIIQQVPQLSKHAICDASTSSTDSSNYIAPEQGEPPLGTTALNVSKHP